MLASKHGKVEVCDLSLHSNTLSSQCFSDLFHKASAAFRSLTSLFLAGNKIGNQITAANTATQTMASSSRLALLQALENTVRNGYLSQLRSLYLTGSLTNDPDTNASWLTTFVEAIFAHCPNLMELGLSHNNIGVPGATALAKIVPRLQKLIDAVPYSPNDIDNNFLLKTRPYRFVGDIQLSQANFGDKGLCSFIDQLEDVCHFDSLGLSGNDIHATGLSCLTDAICCGKILLKGYFPCLNLSDNPIGTQGTVVLCKMLNSNHCELNELLLSRCKLTSTESCLPKTDHMNLDNNVSGDTVREIGQQLCQLPRNNIVTIIDLDGNSLTGDGVHILLGLLHLCVRLRSLFTCNCGITSADLIQLFDHLKSSAPSSYCRASLGEWNLDRNKIDDGGVLTLIEQLTSLFLNFNQTFIVTFVSVATRLAVK